MNLKFTPRKNNIDRMDRITTYEKARLLGTRAAQLSAGATPLVPVKNTSFLEVAELEYAKGVIPINIIRTLPDGRKIRLKFKPR